MAFRSRRGCLVVLSLLVAPPAASAGTLRGTITDGTTGEPAIGATVVASSDADDGLAEQVQITDEQGAYAMTIPGGTYALTVYYDAATASRAAVEVHDGDVESVEHVTIDTSTATVSEVIELSGVDTYATDRYQGGYVVVLPAISTRSAFFDGKPATWRLTEADQPPVWWRRDHRGVDALDARLDPPRTSTSLDRALRLPGSPAIAAELIGAQQAWSSHAPIELAGGAGGVDALALIHGDSDRTASARVALGRASRFAARLGGDVDDELRWATAVVLDQTATGLATQAMVRLDAAWDDNVSTSLSTVLGDSPDDAEDGWIQTRTTAQSDDRQRAVELGLVVQRLVQPAASTRRAIDALVAPREVSRLGGRLALYQNGTWRGRHETVLGGEVGGGRADAASHRDVRVFASDTWRPTSTVAIDAGVRWDRRVVGATAVELLSPRASVAWDSSGRGVANLFAGVERVGQLDERSLGAWRGGDTYGDTAVTGYAREWKALRWTAAMRGRLPRATTAATSAERLDVGFEGSARLAPAHQRWQLDATVSTLARAATLHGGWRHACGRNTFQLAAIARATPDDVAWGATIHAVRAPRPDRHTPSITMGVEALDLDDAARRSAHLILATAW